MNKGVFFGLIFAMATMMYSSANDVVNVVSENKKSLERIFSVALKPDAEKLIDAARFNSIEPCAETNKPADSLY